MKCFSVMAYEDYNSIARIRFKNESESIKKQPNTTKSAKITKHIPEQLSSYAPSVD